MRAEKSTGPDRGAELGTPGERSLPRRVGRYELWSELASGGMGTVYLGRIRGLAGFQRLVAIKCLHPHLLRDASFVGMFIDEARLAALIHHPNVVPTLDVAREDGELFLVMEYVEGASLAELCWSAVSRGTWLPVPVALRVVVDVLQGLQAAHDLVGPTGESLRLIHRDVSPQNVLVGADGVSRLLDFGVAKAEARLAVTEGGKLKGKPSYMAPEQLSAEPAGQQVDVWAAGVVLWEMLTGSRLFKGELHSEVVARVLKAPILPPSRLCAQVAPLDEIVLRALDRDPSLRWPSAAALATAIEEAGVPIARPREVADFLADNASSLLEARRALLPSGELDTGEVERLRASSAAITRVEKRDPGSRRRRWWIGGAVLAVAAASAVAVALALGGGGPRGDEALERPEAAAAETTSADDPSAGAATPRSTAAPSAPAQPGNPVAPQPGPGEEGSEESAGTAARADVEPEAEPEAESADSGDAARRRTGTRRRRAPRETPAEPTVFEPESI